MDRMFDIDELVNTIMQAAQMQAAGREFFVTGFVSSYNPETHCVRCIVPSWINPGSSDAVMTGWVPLATPWAGNGFGLQAAPYGGATQENPTGGEQVVLQILSDDNGTYIGSGMLWSQKAAPALTTIQPGEAIMKHTSGSFLYFKADGSVALNTKANLDATVGGNLNATVTGDATATIDGTATLDVTGAAAVNGQSTVDVTAATSASVTAPTISLGASGQSLLALVTSAMESLFNGHTHDYTVGSGVTDVPNQLMGSSQLTSTVKGG